MKRPVQRGVLIAATVAALIGCGARQPRDADVQRSIAIADQFQSRLQSELKQALQAGGPTVAVAVCSQAAPAIAEQISSETGAEVRRISLRPRNPAAQTTGELRDRLSPLAAQPLDAEGRPALTSWVEGHGNGATHYTLRAVVMKDEPCAACHGVAVAQDVRDAIAVHYPHDQATGFVAGDLRGAILIALQQGRTGSEE
jgi:hypothetical protein